MSSSSPSNPRAPDASGTLERTPLSQLLAYNADKRLTGTFEFIHSGGVERATMVTFEGQILKIRSVGAPVYLGQLLFELGYLDSDALNASLLELAKKTGLHGEILLRRNAITRAHLREGLEAQTARKAHQLFGWPAESEYEFRRGEDGLRGWGGDDFPPLDPLRVLWSGVREFPLWEHVEATLGRVGDGFCGIIPAAALERFGFHGDERAAVDCLRARPMSPNELAATGAAPAATCKLIVYTLLLTKQVAFADARRMSDPNMPAAFRSVPAMRATQQVSGPGSAALRAAMPSAPSSSAIRVPEAGGAAPTASRAAEPAAGARGGAPMRPSAPSMPAARPTQGGAPASRPSQGAMPASRPSQGAMPASRPSQGAMPAARPQGPAQGARPSAPSMQAARPSQASQPEVRVEGAPERPMARASIPGMPRASIPGISAVSATAFREANPALRDAAMDRDLDGAPAKQLFQEAEIALMRKDLDRAERLARRAHSLETERAEFLALLAWVEAQRPENQDPTAIRPRIQMLDRALSFDAKCERAYFYRAQLHKRTNNHGAAFRDFRTAARLNPHNVEAAREARLYEMRGQKASASGEVDMRRSPTPTPDGKRKSSKDLQKPAPSLLERLLKK